MEESAAEEFDRLLREHVPALYRYAYRWTGDVDESEDLVQEALLRLYPELPQLRQIERLRPWVARVMYRIFIDQLRRKKRSPISFVGRSGLTGATVQEDADDEADDLEAADESWNPAELAEQALNHELIAKQWHRLQEQHRVVLSLHEIEGYSLEEVAGIIDAPLGTAKSRLHRARQHLRNLLTEGTKSPAETCNSPGTPQRAHRG